MTEAGTVETLAERLQMDACLHELAGALPREALFARIAAGAHRDGRSAWLGKWFVAAMVVVGSGVVAAVAWQRAAGRQPVTQPPELPVTTPQEPQQGSGESTRSPQQPVLAKWTTLIADYSDNKVLEVDQDGKVVRELNEIFGAWDAELLANGNLLITEFSLSRVREVDRTGATVWEYLPTRWDLNLKNPYDADRLPNGNTLIADTFGSRVIEVTPAQEIVWSYATDVRPFDADRLPNGNTLIADVLKDRVIEVSPAGDIVWELKGMPNAHDADRLPNGNTLVTLRNKGTVVEVDRDGRVVSELKGMSSPSDADRLPNGNTLVAENTRAREFAPDGKVVWEHHMTWAVEVNRYPR